MRYGYFCEDCEVSIWLVAPRSELAWLKDRTHVVREVAKHSATGLDMWIAEGLEFLNDHQGDSVIVVSKK